MTVKPKEYPAPFFMLRSDLARGYNAEEVTGTGEKKRPHKTPTASYGSATEGASGLRLDQKKQAGRWKREI
jgi:hypothetical protein